MLGAQQQRRQLRYLLIGLAVAAVVAVIAFFYLREQVALQGVGVEVADEGAGHVNDGTPLNAEAMKYSLDRHREMKGSSRRSELDHVDAVEVVDPLTIRLRLKAPFSPITAILADRAGMPVSPSQARKLDDKFGTAPVCVGPESGYPVTLIIPVTA